MFFFFSLSFVFVHPPFNWFLGLTANSMRCWFNKCRFQNTLFIPNQKKNEKPNYKHPSTPTHTPTHTYKHIIAHALIDVIANCNLCACQKSIWIASALPISKMVRKFNVPNNTDSRSSYSKPWSARYKFVCVRRTNKIYSCKLWFR